MPKTIKRVKSRKQVQKTISPVMIGLVAVAAIALVAGLILLGNQSRSGAGPIDFSQFPTKGDEAAPVTIIEFSDYG